MSDFMQKIQARRIDGKYSVVRKLGSGGYGVVYLGHNLETGDQVAMKMMRACEDTSRLQKEFDRLRSLRDVPGLAQAYVYCSKDEFQVMVMELLGPSLEDLFAYCEDRFSLKTVLLLMDQLIDRFQELHSRGCLHRDVKPGNCLMGRGEKGNVVHLTDFGSSAAIRMPTDEDLEREKHLPQRLRLVGTARYASVKGHLGQLQCEGDDLISLGYMMIRLLQGALPWEMVETNESTEKHRLVFQMKSGMSDDYLCSEVPPEFARYMKYVKSLQHGQKPDYTMLKSMFRQLAERKQIEYDNIFDWTIRLFFSRPADDTESEPGFDENEG